MLLSHSRPLPAFGIPGHQDQAPLSVYVILSVNETVGDCAAYEGIGPVNAEHEMIETIKSRAEKISKERAESLFPEIEELNLRYRY